MLDGADVPIIIIGFRTPEDISDCLGALARLTRPPSFSVMICENGGAKAFDALTDALVAPGRPCVETPDEAAPAPGLFPRVRRMRLGRRRPAAVAAPAR